MDERNRLILREIPLGRSAIPQHPTAIIEDPNHHPMHAVQRHQHRLHPALIEERIVIQHREMQTLLLDNQRLAATHVALKQELTASQQELRHISASASKVKAERDAQIREFYERSLKLEAEVRAIEALKSELAQAKTDVQKLSASKLQLTSQLETINGDLTRVHEELHQANSIKAHIDTMHHEVERGRAAVEYEKKVHSENVAFKQAMEKNMITLAGEVEKLRSELANADKKAQAATAAAASMAAPANPGSVHAESGNPEMGFGGNPYINPYSMHQVQGVVDPGLQYGSGAITYGSYDMQQTQLHR